MISVAQRCDVSQLFHRNVFSLACSSVHPRDFLQKPPRDLIPSDTYLHHDWVSVSTTSTWTELERNAHHDDVIKWKHFSHYWPFVRGIHRSPVNSPHKGQWRGALIFSLTCIWINGWVNNRAAGDLRPHRVHYDVSVMICWNFATSVIMTTPWYEKPSAFWQFVMRIHWSPLDYSQKGTSNAEPCCFICCQPE